MRVLGKSNCTVMGLIILGKGPTYFDLSFFEGFLDWRYSSLTLKSFGLDCFLLAWFFLKFQAFHLVLCGSLVRFSAVYRHQSVNDVFGQFWDGHEVLTPGNLDW